MRAFSARTPVRQQAFFVPGSSLPLHRRTRLPGTDTPSDLNAPRRPSVPGSSSRKRRSMSWAHGRTPRQRRVRGQSRRPDRQPRRVRRDAPDRYAPFDRGVPRDRERSIGVLRRAIELGVNHIDTAAFYFSATRSANELINRRWRRTRRIWSSPPRSGRPVIPRARGGGPHRRSCAARSRRTCANSVAIIWTW